MGKRARLEKDFVLWLAGLAPFLSDLRSLTLQDTTLKLISEYASTIGIENEIKWQHIVQYISRSDATELKALVSDYQRIRRLKRNAERNINRTLVADLHLRDGPVSFRDMDIQTIRRNRDHFTDIKIRQYLLDAGNEGLSVPGKANYIVDPAEGWYTVEADESAIFVDDNDVVQLVVVRNVTGLPDLLADLNTVIDEAMSDRRNVRPTHEGCMVQSGYNAGSRSCRVWGLANNFKNAKKFSPDEKQQKDNRILGVMALAWHIFRSHAPCEVVRSVDESIRESGMPEMGAEFEEYSDGYNIEYLGHNLRFPHVSRSPCEGYLVTEYAAPVHADRTYADYSFSLFTQHMNSRPEIAIPGGNYVDITLGVRVISEMDTLLVFRPAFKHGTTRSNPCLKRAGVVLAFSQHIKDAYDRVVEKQKEGVICDIEPLENIEHV